MEANTNPQLLASAPPGQVPGSYPHLDEKSYSNDPHFVVADEGDAPPTQYNFIVVGPTGVGKTTFVQYMTKGNTKEMKGHGAGTTSKTKEEKTTKSQQFSLDKNPEKFVFSMTDTRGFGAHDMNEERIFESLNKEIVNMGAMRVNCIIIIHKMERFLQSTKESLKKLLNLFKRFDVDPRIHTLLVITHSGIYTDKVKRDYKQDLCNKLTDFVSEDNVIHANFVKAEELHKEFRAVYHNVMRCDVGHVRKKLIGFRDPFDPGIYLNRVMNRENLKQKLKKMTLYKFTGFGHLVLCILAIVLLAVMSTLDTQSSLRIVSLIVSALAGVIISIFIFLQT
eukprot:jgi/Bigna1/88466/estExt_fgenesh1_pg.C_320093